MCLALPAEIIRVDGDTATVDVDGTRMPVSLAFLSDVAPGDFVVVHVGFALSRIDAATAEAQLRAMREGAEVMP